MGNMLVKGLTKALFGLVVVTALVGVSPKNVEAAKKITMDRTKVTCVAKERFTLKVKNAGNKKITWESSKPSVATVSRKGNVVTKKAGKATIRAKVNKKTVTCNVTVKKNASKPWCIYSKKTIHVGESFLLIEGSCTNYETIFSHNDRIATVTPEGRVTGTGVGTVKILVSRGYNKKEKEYMDYYCTVTVVAGSAPKCSHNWMDTAKYNSNGKETGFFKLKVYTDEGFDMCRTCGLKLFDSDEMAEHQLSEGHGGVYQELGATNKNVGKFGYDMYCSKCGLCK